jgi:CRISPR-associated endonuclease Csn1
MARRAGQAEERDERLFAGIEPPFPQFRTAVRDALEAMLVSYKPEHGKDGALHEDTAYGLVRDAAAAEIGNLVRRKPVDSLTGADVDRVRDPLLRAKLVALRAPFADAKGKVTNAKAFQQALRGFAETQGVRRVRVGKEDASVVEIADRRTGAPYKAVVPGENHHMDIVQMRDGTWRGFAETVYAVNRKDWRPIWEKERTGGKLVMRLHKGDMIEIDDPDGARRVKVVVRLNPSGARIYLAPHNEGGDFQKRHDDPHDLFRWDLAGIGRLKERNARAVRVDEAGRKRVRRSNVWARNPAAH